jgi:Flp pilus assembly CpaE family ATPase
MLSALRNARTLIGEIKTLKSHLKDMDLVVNMQGIAASEEVPAKDIQNALGVEPAATVAWLPKVFGASEGTGKPVGQSKDKAAPGVLETLMPIAVKGSAADNKAIKALGGAGKKEAAAGGFLKKMLGK